MSLFLLVLNFAVSLWLGAYLLARDPSSDRLRWTGLGLVFYALSLLCLVPEKTSSGFAQQAEVLCNDLPAIPAVFWTGSLISLLPESNVLRSGLKTAWAYGQVPLVAAIFVLKLTSGLRGPEFTGGLLDSVFALLVLFPLLAVGFLIVRLAGIYRPRRALGLLLIGLLLFTVSTAFVILPLAWFPRTLILLALGVDLLILGVAISILDAFDLGEALFPDFLRSGIYAGLAAIVFGLPVALAISYREGPSEILQLLLFSLVALAILWQTFRDPFERNIERLLLSPQDEVSAERTALLKTARSLAKMDPRIDPLELDPDQFSRLTRQAISQFGNLPRLAASPLTRLPLIDQRLAQRGQTPNSLARAAELKALIGEAIQHLKPESASSFGETEEWRYYNALYFPYVVGIRPYTRRQSTAGLSPEETRALDWFRTQIPERTLYNWQTAAAKLIADYIREAE